MSEYRPRCLDVAGAAGVNGRLWLMAGALHSELAAIDVCLYEVWDGKGVCVHTKDRGDWYTRLNVQSYVAMSMGTSGE